MLHNLIEIFKYPLKSKNLEKYLEKWYQSALWSERAKSFVKDRRIENLALMRQQFSQDPDSRMDVDEQNGKSLDFLKEKQVWTVDEGEELMQQTQTKHLYYDQLLFNNLEEKVSLCKLLKASLKAALSDYNDLKTLKKYIKELRHFENIDFKKEIHESEKKLRILNEAQIITNNDGKHKLSIEKMQDVAS